MEDNEKSKSNLKGDEKIVSLAKERFKASLEASQEFREEAAKDLEFKVGNHWDPKLKASREKDSRPVVTINKIPQHSNIIVNDIRQNRPSIKVYPVDDKADIPTAKVIQGLFRQVEYQSGADVAYDCGVTSAVDTGLGFLRAYPEYVSHKSFNQRLKIAKIDNLFSVVFDHNSSELDGSDAEFGFVYSDISPTEFKRKYPNAEIDEDKVWDDESTVTDDWVKKDSVRIADYYCKEYTDALVLLLSSGVSVLEDELSTYLADLHQADPVAAANITVIDKRKTQVPKVMSYKLAGHKIVERSEFPAPYIPIIPIYGSVVNINGKKHIYGIIRFLRDPAFMYDVWVSAETEAIALAPKAPFVGYEGQFEGHEDKWATANHKTHAYLEVKPMSVGGQPAALPQRQQYEPAIMAITQAKMGANEDMKAVTSQYDASLGRQSNETSGIAIRGRQQQTQTANFHFPDNLARSIRHLGRIGIHIIPKIYDTARIERIMGEDGSDELVKINQPTEIQKGIEGIFNLTVGEYDVAVETGPSFATKRQEAVASIMDFIRAYPAATQIVGDLLVKNMDWPEAEEIANRLKKTIPPHLLGEDGALPPEAQAQITQMQQAIQTLQGALQAAEMKLQVKELENQSKERMKYAELEVDLQKKQMELSANPSLPDVLRNLVELQQYQVANGAPQINQNLNWAQAPMDASVMVPQQNNPTGGFSPG